MSLVGPAGTAFSSMRQLHGANHQRDRLFGGADDDDLHPDAGRRPTHGGDGNDTLSGGAGFDYGDGGPGRDSTDGHCERTDEVP